MLQKKKTLILAIFFTFLITLAIAPSQLMAQDTDKGEVTLREGTPIFLKLLEELSSKTVAMGQTINLAISQDVAIDGYIVIARDTPADGRVTMVEQASRVGGAGKIYFSLDRTEAVNKQRIVLRTTLGQQGKNSETAAVALGVVCCPFFLLMKGDEATYPVGTEFKGYVAQDYVFKKSDLQAE